MSYEADIGGAVGNALTFGMLQPLDDMLDDVGESLKIKSATAGSGDVQVELQNLVAFYNTLSDLHQTLFEQRQQLHNEAVSLNGSSAGGSVPGVKAAWTAMADSAGVMQHAGSLYGNMLAVDHLILSHMQSLQHNAQQYAAQENMAIKGFGSASAGEGGPSAGHASAPASAGSVRSF